jgi:hypothetical protein
MVQAPIAVEKGQILRFLWPLIPSEREGCGAALIIGMFFVNVHAES